MFAFLMLVVLCGGGFWWLRLVGVGGGCELRGFGLSLAV